MGRVTRNGLIAVAAVSGAMAMTGSAFADSAADGSAADSPGAISGNSIQLPVHVPLNVCGNTVDVVGLLNPAMGNTCVNEGGKGGPAETSSGGAAAQGGTTDAPGVISGNGLQLPVDLPVNVSGNTVDVVGIGNPAFGNQSGNTPEVDRPEPTAPPEQPEPRPSTPPEAHHPAPKPVVPDTARPAPEPAGLVEEPAAGSLAETGADRTVPALAASAALVAGGIVLRRRFRPGANG
ncbi:chaplin family protein [Streptomyces sp. NPDC085946]|uniref:chaplin n=1 Tax=Streptomyces sp. NPDC085946 TaxID=3365744 RepID=UPI0037D90325